MGFSTIPKVTWGSGFVNTLRWGWRPDVPISYSKPLQGSELNIQYNSGLEDAWIVDTEYYVEMDMRWIDKGDFSGSFGVQTGWTGSIGVRSFIEYAHNANTVRFYPDKDSATYIESYMVSPGIDDVPTLEADGTRRVRFVFRNITSNYDAV